MGIWRNQLFKLSELVSPPLYPPAECGTHVIFDIQYLLYCCVLCKCIYRSKHIASCSYIDTFYVIIDRFPVPTRPWPSITIHTWETRIADNYFFLVIILLPVPSVFPIIPAPLLFMHYYHSSTSGKPFVISLESP